MGVDVRHHEVHSSSALSACCPIHSPVRPCIPAAYEYVPAVAQFFEGFVHLLLYVGRGTASAGAEIDECVVGDGRAEDGLECAGNERGGGCRLEDRSFVSPEKSETGLNEGAKGSGEPRIGSVILVCCL